MVMQAVETKDWFKNWFDSPYYDLLYKDRDQTEADAFIQNLVNFLKPSPNAFMLDLACGKGRHSISLNKKGFNVTGIDISAKNIHAAEKHNTKNLSFYIHDMRKSFMANYYNYVFNLFTSIGYFENARENDAVFTNVHHALKSGGVFVLDFVNVHKATQCLSHYDEREIEGIKFQVSKKIDSGFLVKDIHVIDNGKQFDFEEKVHMFTEPLLKQTLVQHGFEVLNIFGDYNLNAFDLEQSDRFILISKKK